MDADIKVIGVLADKYTPKIDFDIDLVEYLNQGNEYYSSKVEKIKYSDIK